MHEHQLFCDEFGCDDGVTYVPYWFYMYLLSDDDDRTMEEFKAKYGGDEEE